jgi:mRNA interferase ChpB
MVLPITGGGSFARRITFAVPITGIKGSGGVRCDQPCILDINACNGREVDMLPRPILDEALAKTVTLFV